MADHAVQQQPAAEPWHARDASAVLAALDAPSLGLSPEEAERRLALHGPNRLPTARRRGPLTRFLLQFHNLLIYVLIASGIVSLLLGHPVDAAVIGAVVLANAIIGFIQEGKAEDALAAISGMIDPHATVLRDGGRRTIPADAVVPGDIVLLEAGDRVPADLRLLRSRALRAEEAALTGESVPADKSPDPVAEAAALGDRSSMAYSGTFIAAGQGQGVVVATGAATELGRISGLLGAVTTLTTPLIRQMDGFARDLTIFILVVSVAAFGFAVWVRDYLAEEAFMAVVGLAVASIPAGLPAVMTITLAIGVQRMAARNAIIRRLPAVETLGSVSVICSDKTGTLTRNEMTSRRIVTAGGGSEIGGSGYGPDPTALPGPPGPEEIAVIRAGLLCNDAELHHAEGGWRVNGDPMEGALVTLAMKAGMDPDLTRRQLPRRDEIPFDAAHRFMATLHHSHDGEAFILIKGAPERILALCDAERRADGDHALDAEAWQARADALAASGQRVLGFARKSVPFEKRELGFTDVEEGAVLLGLVGFIDPPRDEAMAAIADCHAAGVRVVMITGDHAETAREIGRQLGLAPSPRVMIGSDIETLDDAALRRAAREADVFARTTPEHKLRLVRALQAEGLVVAMTGDGVNDAPALKRADVGVAMGRKGTEAAKEAAQMVLADDNFASIVAAVREGRTVYDNLIKVIGWTLPTNGGEALTILAAIALGLALPVSALQILWINMITAVALGLTLAFEPMEPGTMRRPPRRADQPILTRDLIWRVAFVSALMAIGAFGMFNWAESRGLGIDYARTMVVNTLVSMEIFYLFSVRYVHGTSLTWQGVLGTRAVLLGVAATTAAQVLFTYLPFFQQVFGTRPLALLDGVAVIGAGVVLLLILEVEKRARGGLTRRPA